MDPSADWLNLPNILAVILSGIVLESLRRFADQLSKLQESDQNLDSRITELKLDMVKTYVSRSEVSSAHRDIRVDMKAHHEVQMSRLDDVINKIERRIDKLSDTKADKDG